jgi:thioredoxin reductase
MLRWSPDVVLCTDGSADLSQENRDRLARHGIPVRETPIARLEGSDGVLEWIVFQDGERLARRALFFNTGYRQASGLAERLGCALTDKGTVRTGAYEITHVEGLYVAGDASQALQLAIVAAAEGAQAAFAINTALLKDEIS